MALFINGTEIPTYVANAITANGLNVTRVFSNGVLVWEQQLLNAIWSGNSLIDFFGLALGLETSGALFRWRNGSNYGQWLTVYTNGTFQSGATTTTVSNITKGFASGGFSNTSANGIKHYGSYIESLPEILFDISSGFSGNSLDAGNDTGLESSSGLIRYVNRDSAVFEGAWVSLT